MRRELDYILIQLGTDAINVRASGKGIRSSSPRDGCFECGGAHFPRDCNVHVTPHKGNGKKGKQSKFWSKSAGKGKIHKGNKERKKKPPKISKGSKSADGSCKGKTSKTGLSGLEIRNQRQVQTLRNLHRRITVTVLSTDNSWFDDGWSEMMTGARLDDMRVGNKPMTIPQAHSLWEVLISVQ